MRTSLIAAAFFVSGAAAANAASFVIDTPSPSTAPFTASSITGTLNGGGFTLTGFTVNDDLSGETQVDVGFDGTGFGVAGVSGTPAGTIDGETVQSAPSDFSIDGINVDQNELLRITFDQQITVTGFGFGLVDRRDDVTLRVDGGAPDRFGLGGNTSQNAGDLDALTNLMLTGTTFDIIAGFPNPNAQNVLGGGGNDLFQLTDVQPIPVPAALPLLGAGLGLMAWVGRRRQRA